MATANLSKDLSEQIQFKQLLEEAVTKPGTLMRAYSLFWNYSLGNQILALLQANQRGIPLGPIASFNRWKEVGQHVKRGEKAITLCMPVTIKRTIKGQGPDGAETESEVAFKRFVFKRNWFMLAQTDSAEYQQPSIPTWDRARALRTLTVEETRSRCLAEMFKATQRAARSPSILWRRCLAKPFFTNSRTLS